MVNAINIKTIDKPGVLRKVTDFLAKKNHDKKYYSFGQRLFFNTLLFLILLLLGIFFLIKSFDCQLFLPFLSPFLIVSKTLQNIPKQLNF